MLDSCNVDRDGTSDAYSDVLKMLHLFVWPRVKFHAADQDRLNSAQKEVDRHLQRINKQICEKLKMMKSSEDQMDSTRLTLIQGEHFSSTAFVRSCDKGFLEMFLCHLKTCIGNWNEKFTRMHDSIHQIRNSSCAEEQMRLAQLRRDRDELHKILEQAMYAREEIASVLNHGYITNPTELEENVRQLMEYYVRLSKYIIELKARRNDLIKLKIQISSVREAVLLTLNELERGEVSYGYTRSKGVALSDTDITPHVTKPVTWKTFREKVSQCLMDEDSELRSSHEEFCERVQRLCQLKCHESELFSFPLICSSSTEGVSLSVSVSGESCKSDVSCAHQDATRGLPDLGPASNGIRSARDQQCMLTEHKQNDNVGAKSRETQCDHRQLTRGSVAAITTDECVRLCEDIVTHNDDMVKNIMTHLFPGNDENVNEVYICYEEHVSARLMKLLSILHEHAYVDSCPGLSRCLLKMQWSEVQREDLKHLCMPHPQGISEGSPYRETSNYYERSREEVSTANLSRKVLTLTDTPSDVPRRNEEDSEAVTRRTEPENKDGRGLDVLYHMYDDMDESMPERFTAVFSMDPCPAVFDSLDINTSLDFNSSSPKETNSSPSHTNSRLPTANTTSSPVDTRLPAACSDQLIPFNGDTSESEINKHPRNAKSNSCDDVSRLGNLQRDKDGRVVASTFENGVLCRPRSRSLDLETSWSQSTNHSGTYGTTVCENRMNDSANPHRFREFEELTALVDNECTCFGKLRKSMDVVRYVVTSLNDLKRDTGQEEGVCTDDLLDAFTYILCRIDRQRALRFYTQLNLITNLKPGFLQHVGDYEYMLVNLNAAFSHLFQQ